SRCVRLPPRLVDAGFRPRRYCRFPASRRFSMPRLVPRTLLLCLASLAAAAAGAAPPLTATEMMKLERLADPQLSPDGSQVAYGLTRVDLEARPRNADLWLIPLAGGEPRRLTSNPASDTRPRFSPDGRSLAFLSTRGGSSQVWLIDLAGGEPR